MPPSPPPSFYLTEAQAAGVGLTEEGARNLVNRLSEKVGYVLGATGRGGSGVWIENPQGYTGLLTARHVAIAAILTGELTLVESDGQFGRSKRAETIWIHPTSDLAVIAADASPPRLPLAEWSVEGGTKPVAGDVVLAIGAPGAWKSEPDLATRSIATMGTLCFWATVVDVSGAIVVDVAPEAQVPESFRGMSGGPVFDLTGSLLGVLECESPLSGARTLQAIPRPEFSEFVIPFQPDSDAPAVQRERLFEVDATVCHPRYRVPAMHLVVVAEHWLAKVQNEHRHAAFGRILLVEFRPPSGHPRTVQLERIYYFPLAHDEHARAKTLRSEVAFLLEAMEFTVLGIEVHEV